MIQKKRKSNERYFHEARVQEEPMTLVNSAHAGTGRTVCAFEASQKKVQF